MDLTFHLEKVEVRIRVDLIIWFLLLAFGRFGLLTARSRDYVLWAAGVTLVYINMVLRLTDREYVYSTRGPPKYFTYWRFLIY